jgi:hypothetical protein
MVAAMCAVVKRFDNDHIKLTAETGDQRIVKALGVEFGFAPTVACAFYKS